MAGFLVLTLFAWGALSKRPGLILTMAIIMTVVALLALPLAALVPVGTIIWVIYLADAVLLFAAYGQAKRWRRWSESR